VRIAKKTAWALLLSSALGAAGCDDRGGVALAATATASPRAATSAPSSRDGDANEALAMADPQGTETVDVTIRALQAAVKKLDRAEEKILLGRAWIRKARETADPGYYLHARAVAEQLLARTPDDPLALGLLGQTQLNGHQFKEALETADAILARAPEDLTALGIRSDAALERGDYEEALRAAEKLLDLKPGLPSYARASYLSFLHGDTHAAKENARLAIESGNDPTDPEPRCFVLSQTATMFFHAGDYRGADAGYKRALSECPDYHHALAGRGRVALALGDAKAAVSFLARATAKSRSVEMQWRLGDALSAAGDEAGAKKAYDEVVSRGKLEDHRTLAQFLATKNRDADLAVDLARKEMAIRPGIYTEDALAWALYRKGELEEAKRLSARALRLKTPDATLELHRGAILIASGDREEGVALVRRALERNPELDPTSAAEAKRLVE